MPATSWPLTEVLAQRARQLLAVQEEVGARVLPPQELGGGQLALLPRPGPPDPLQPAFTKGTSM